MNKKEITQNQLIKELQQSEENYRSIIETFPDGVLTVDTKGFVTSFNTIFTKLTGYSNEEIVGKHISKLPTLYKRDIPKYLKLFAQLILGKKLKSPQEFNWIHKDGTKRLGEVHYSVIRSNGKITGLQAIARDITKRKQVEESLRESESRLTEAQAIAHIGNWSWDLRTNELLWSKENYRIFGLSHDVPPSYENFEKAIHFEDREFVNKSVENALKRKKPYDIEFRIILPNGKERIVKAIGKVDYDNEDLPIRFFGTVQDITERKKMEQQLLTNDRLASLGELVSGVAHELNNPLTSVIGFSELLAGRKDLPDDVKEDIKIINREAQRTSGIVKNLLTFAREQPKEKQPTDINSTIKVVLELRAYEQKVNNIEVNTDFTPDLPEIMGNAFNLQQVFLNIIVNAEHAMLKAHGKGVLTITTEQDGDTIRVSLTDDGPGISKENLGHVFDPFFTTKEVGKGTGLGLSICYGTITEHDGKIYAESELGNGTTFIIELPVATTDNEGATSENS